MHVLFNVYFLWYKKEMTNLYPSVTEGALGICVVPLDPFSLSKDPFLSNSGFSDWIDRRQKDK